MVHAPTHMKAIQLLEYVKSYLPSTYVCHLMISRLFVTVALAAKSLEELIPSMLGSQRQTFLSPKDSQNHTQCSISGDSHCQYSFARSAQL